jgi:predicted Co/Zn/Cd cation transporter (cation efflux family)
MEAGMSFVRLYSAHRRRRASRANLIVLGVSAWLVLGLISQAAFQLIG